MIMMRFQLRWLNFIADSIAHLLTLIFQNSLATAIFVNDWKKENIAHKIHKKI